MLDMLCLLYVKRNRKMSIYNENPESSIANPFFSSMKMCICGRLASWKQTFNSEWDMEKEITTDAFLNWKKIEPFQIHARTTLKCQSSLKRVRSNFSWLWAEIKLTHLFTQAWSFPSNTQGPTPTVIPIKAAATGENGNLSSLVSPVHGLKLCHK